VTVPEAASGNQSSSNPTSDRCARRGSDQGGAQNYVAKQLPVVRHKLFVLMLVITCCEAQPDAAAPLSVHSEDALGAHAQHMPQHYHQLNPAEH
jgi:hypothetical protein